MESKNNLRSIIRQVKATTEEATSRLGFNRRQSSSANAAMAPITQLDLSSAIEYNRLLINSYLEEKGQRELPLYDRIIGESEESEQAIIDSIRTEFFNSAGDIISTSNENQNCDNHDQQQQQADVDDKVYDEDKILELCVLSRLPPLQPSDHSGTFGAEFLQYISTETEALTRQVTIVSKRLSDLIVANDQDLKAELGRITAIDSQLRKALQICAQGRGSLKKSKDNFTTTSLSIVDNYRVRQSITKLIECLQNVKTIRSTIEHIHYQLEYEKNFIDALKLYQETWTILEQMQPNLQCVEEMKSRLANMLGLAEEQMDHVLAGMPFSFCLDTYEQLCRAYQEIGRSEVLVHQLLLHYTNTIHDKAFAIVHGYVQLFVDMSPSATSTPVKGNKKKDATTDVFEGSQGEFQRKPYADLCLFLKPESFLSCLVDLCRALWDVMQNYHRTLSFYRSPMAATFLSEDSRNFAITKLEQGLLGVWSDIQTKIRTLVSSVKFVDVSEVEDNVDQENVEADKDDKGDNELHQHDQLLFTFDEFIKMLTVCEKMIEVGVQFVRVGGGEESHHDRPCSPRVDSAVIELQKTLYKQTRAYFQSYHRKSMAELRIFLENETWTRCPIESKCELELIANLQEFSFIKNRLNGKKVRDREQTQDQSRRSSSFLLSPSSSTTFSGKNNRHFFDDQKVEENDKSPFDEIFHLNSKMYDDFSDEDVVVVADKDGEEPKLSESQQDIIATNTALNVVRLMGRYMHIMYLLRPISHDIIKALLELFDYYFYTVYQFFCIDAHAPQWLTNYLTATGQTIVTNNNNNSNVNGKHNELVGGKKLVSELRSFLRRVNDTLIVNETRSLNRSTTSITTGGSNCSPNNSPKKVGRYHCPTLPAFVECDQLEGLFATAERIMAIESLIFIARQFYHLCPFLLHFLRKDEEERLDADKAVEDGFKMLQLYHDQMCSNVESLMYQCLSALSTKVLPYETILASMAQVRWDLGEIPSMHSAYVDMFVKEVTTFNQCYLQRLTEADLAFLGTSTEADDSKSSYDRQKSTSTDSNQEDDNDEEEMPLVKLGKLSWQVTELLWEAIVRVSNRVFVEGFSQTRKCTQEGRALMQLDYQQFLTNVERILLPYFQRHHGGPIVARSRVKALLANEKEFVEEYIKAYYLTEEALLEWIRSRPEYTGRQLVALVHAMTADNKKMRATLLATITADVLNTTE